MHSSLFIILVCFKSNTYTYTRLFNIFLLFILEVYLMYSAARESDIKPLCQGLLQFCSNTKAEMAEKFVVKSITCMQMFHVFWRTYTTEQQKTVFHVLTFETLLCMINMFELRLCVMAFITSISVTETVRTLTSQLDDTKRHKALDYLVRMHSCSTQTY